MEWKSGLYRLMTQILVFSGCCFKQGNNVCATNRHDRASDDIALSRSARPSDISFGTSRIQALDDIALSRTVRSSDDISQSRNAKYADFMNCENEEFQCQTSGACISKMAICDRNTDCFFYGEDELDCPSTECPAGAFQCKSGECLSYTYRCSGQSDCWDRSDEIGCESSTCPPHFYMCHNGQCIERKRRCDGNNFEIAQYIVMSLLSGTTFYETDVRKKYWSRDSNGSYVYSDCSDGSDEWNCENYTCPADHFKCTNGQCVSLLARCDNNTEHRSDFIQDCNDGSDEEDCGQSECGDYFRCSDGRCVHPSGLCDDVAQCDDAGDEQDCYLDNAVCPLHSFSCRPGHCVPYTYRCTARSIPIYNNIRNHCPKTLEDHCPLSKCPAGYFRCRTGQCMRYDICNRQDNVNFCDQITDPIDHCGVTDCPRDYFRCENGHCLHHVSVCDNVSDCPGGEDERHCGGSECHENQVDCGDGNCIPNTLNCDGYRHCENGQDEQNCSLYHMELASKTLLSCWVMSPHVSSVDITSCSVICASGCLCKYGLVDCSSTTFIFSGEELTIHNQWPFETLFNGYFDPPVPDTISLTRLHGLLLSKSSLTAVPVGALRYIPYLQVLDLSHNLLTHLGQHVFNYQYRLSLLDLSYNQIQTIDGFAFKGLRILHLYLNNNPIKHFGPDMFTGLAADGAIYTDDFRFCDVTIRPAHLPSNNCFLLRADSNGASSCDGILYNFYFRVLAWVILLASIE